MWLDRTHLMLLAVSSCVYTPSFRPIAPFFLLAKYHFELFLIQKGVWPYIHDFDISLITLILNTYGFVGLTSTIQV